MRRFVVLAVAVLAISAVSIFLALRAADDTQPAGASWEYRAMERSQIVDLALEAKKAGRQFDPKANGLTRGLNLLAEEGWELVAIDPAHRFEGVTTVTSSHGGSQQAEWSREQPSEYIFRRPR